MVTHRACVGVSLRLLDRDRTFALRGLRPGTRRVDMLTPPGRRGGIAVRLVTAAATLGGRGRGARAR